MDAGLPEDGVLETSRIIGISMANLADANVDLVGEAFTEPGVDERELALRYAAAARTMAPLLGETLLHAYRIHLRERIRQAVISEAEVAAGRISGSDEVTIAFADIVGFTRLGESLEIEQIGDLTGRLFELASDAARPPVRLVKMIGDAAMFASLQSSQLLEAVLGLVESAGTEGIPPLRAGVARGQALGRGGTGTGGPSTWRPGSPASPGPIASSSRRRSGTRWKPRAARDSASRSRAGTASRGSAESRRSIGSVAPRIAERPLIHP